ncbi:tautomerase family protein [Campylobacter canadensis]|uniref:4-oxalocrotonate tautomerase family protein n=1 Tax=Campylobacter canadensis TaxID=449520 RepID=A0ABS7WRC7_9BACT|nr:4-oxalocrotonate tautomerase family protein [Campylobacter canadensis]MBZ7986499.1 4-oxalocrotonate tautomerase family protein [Campylobacter canadensis]MBZ7994098.1 4-oxalocrotonate tautomerase family protein [Campylobacter canadensis]MBZ7995899.1 4-oxalocrotonate tautomerase family protein [Campylobacter canadensis]MBZ7997536.1 4-oxalocrotonate tautomerase family protein [Campylobacter canadensis]MBZ7999429.1 4-oxalocrotonate tautomerase family protein [Campylobacter canadensis]
MPIINVKLASPMPSNEKCEEIISDLTKYFEEKLGKKRERIVVCLEEVNPNHIGFAGNSVEKIKQNEFLHAYKE